jgi:hypothetical protein
MTWLKILIPAEDVARGLHTHLQDKFRMATGRMRGAKDLAMFGPLEGAADHVCYFSPACLPLVGDFLRMRGAVECEAPRRGEVVLLAGDPVAAEELLARP